MALHGIFSKAAKSPGQPAKTRRARPLAAAAVAATAATAAMALSLAATGAASASTTPTLTYGTLDTQPGNAAAEHKAGVTNAMFEFNWASFEPTQGVLSASYLATMKSELAAYAAAGQKVTLGLGLENPPSWVFKLANSTYTDQTGAASPDANLVFSAAVRPPPPPTCPWSPPTCRCPASGRSGSAPAPATARCSTPATAPTGPSTTPP